MFDFFKKKTQQVFRQKQDEKGNIPGGPFLIELLFREPVELPERETILAVLEKRIGRVESFGGEKVYGFAALDHQGEFAEGKKAPVQLMLLPCSDFKGEGFDAFRVSQMWYCQEERERVLRECRYQVIATDMLAAALPIQERAALDADFIDALAELFPSCEAFYFQSSGKMFLTRQVREHGIGGLDRFIMFGVNVRFFNIEGTGDMLIDTLGMGVLFLPDLQYHFHGLDSDFVVNHAYNLASYLLANDNPIKAGDTVDGVGEDGTMNREIQWKCRYEMALIQPRREVLDICMGEYASGQRE